jgi:hypothetical protein
MNKMTGKGSSEDGFVVPDPSKIREDIRGDAGDEANVIRFSEEQALIEEQAHGIRPDTYRVPRGEPSMVEALGNLDLPPEDVARMRWGDSSDDGLHGGAEK